MSNPEGTPKNTKKERGTKVMLKPNPISLGLNNFQEIDFLDGCAISCLNGIASQYGLASLNDSTREAMAEQAFETAKSMLIKRRNVHKELFNEE